MHVISKQHPHALSESVVKTCIDSTSKQVHTNFITPLWGCPQKLNTKAKISYHILSGAACDGMHTPIQLQQACTDGRKTKEQQQQQQQQQQQGV